MKYRIVKNGKGYYRAEKFTIMRTLQNDWVPFRNWLGIIKTWKREYECKDFINKQVAKEEALKAEMFDKVVYEAGKDLEMPPPPCTPPRKP